MLFLVLVLKDSLRTNFKSLSLSLPVQSLKSPYWKIWKSLIVRNFACNVLRNFSSSTTVILLLVTYLFKFLSFILEATATFC